MTCQRFADQGQRANVDLVRWAITGRSVFEPAIAAEIAHQLAAGGIDITVTIATANSPASGDCIVSIAYTRAG